MNTMTRRASAASLATVAAFAVASSASAATSPSDAGASFLASQLKAGGHQISTTYGGVSYPDQGLSADAILALESLHVAGSEIAASNTVFASTVASYVSYGDDLYAGALAKSIIVAKAAGANPMNFGGKDLVTSLKGLEADNGRFVDKSAYGNNSNNFGQSLGIIGLKKAGSPADAKAVSFLLSQQCADGGFKLFPDVAGCSADPDTTALAVQALHAAGGNSAAIKKAMAFLDARQGADGGVTGGTATEVENSNSTGLAAVAFALTGDTARAAKARSFVASLQYGCSAPESLRGGIAWSKGDFATVTKSKTAIGNETRATAQAVLAFTQQPYLTVSAAGATAATPAISCSTTPTSTTKPAPTSTTSTHTTKPTSKPSTTSTTPVPTASSTTQPSSTAPATPTAPATSSTPTSSATGPVVNTDKTSGSDSLSLELGLAALALITAGGTVAFARRR